jgi:hypothetical protein
MNSAHWREGRQDAEEIVRPPSTSRSTAGRRRARGHAIPEGARGGLDFQNRTRLVGCAYEDGLLPRNA